MYSPVFLLGTLIKTIRFNFNYFPLRTAVKMPVIVSHNVYLKEMSGQVEIQGDIKRGKIRIGFGDIGIFDKQRSRGIWFVQGHVIFAGRADIGHSVKINVHENGELHFGDKFIANAETSIICRKQIVFGANNLISWQCMITDTDFHTILQHGEQINPDQPIIVGDRVWIGMRSTVLKGAKIANDIVVGANSLVHDLNELYRIYAGLLAKKVKNDISWTCS